MPVPRLLKRLPPMPAATPLATAPQATPAPPLALRRASLPWPTTVAPIAALRLGLSWRAASFFWVVLLPVALAAAYYLLIAADQYVTDFRFTLSTAEAPRIDPLALLAGGAAQSPAKLESQILVGYIASRAIVDAVDPSLDLRRLFSPPQADWWARLPPGASIEELVRYWKAQVDPFYDPADGAIIVHVRAFTPRDALRLSQAIVAACERLVNDLSLRARQDALREAESELSRAETRLAAALAQLRALRDREGLIDPAESARMSDTLATRLRDQLIQANTQLQTLRTYMRDDAPPIKVLKARIRSLESQRRSLARELTDHNHGDASALSHVLGSYEQLESERKFAEAAYQLALHRVDEARANADRQHVFIASFVPPSLPEEALYPRRWRALGTVALLALALWGIGGIVVQSIRDHVT